MQRITYITIVILVSYFASFGFSSENELLKIRNQDPLKSYSKLMKKLDGSYYHTNQYVYFQFNEPYSVATGTNLTYSIYNFKKEEVTSLPTLNVNYGENFYAINLDLLTMTADKFYTLQVQDSKGEKWYLRIYYSAR